MKAIIWSRENCSYCVMAEELLKQRGAEIEIRKIDEGWTREQLLESVPNARSVPQIFLDGQYVGGYTELKRHIAERTV